MYGVREAVSQSTGALQQDSAYNADGVSFIVPALNEEVNLRDTIEEIRAAAQALDDYEIILVNDGSSDRTPEIMQELASSDHRVRVIHNSRNMGLGHAYKVGVAEVRMPYVIMVPGDNNHSAADGIIPILCCRGQADVIIPYVSNRNVRSVHRIAISSFFSGLMNTLFGMHVRYYNGLVLHRRDLIQKTTIETNGFCYQAEALVRLLKNGASFIQIPVVIGAHGDRNSRAFRLQNLITIGRTILLLLSVVYLQRQPSGTKLDAKRIQST